jgi:hypothetical protein
MLFAVASLGKMDIIESLHSHKQSTDALGKFREKTRA